MHSIGDKLMARYVFPILLCSSLPQLYYLFNQNDLFFYLLYPGYYPSCVICIICIILCCLHHVSTICRRRIKLNYYSKHTQRFYSAKNICGFQKQLNSSYVCSFVSHNRHRDLYGLPN